MSDVIVPGVLDMIEMFSNTKYENTWSYVTVKEFAESYPCVEDKTFILTELKRTTKI
jgi:hypothetical protein